MAAEALAFLSDTPCKMLHANSATASELLQGGDFVTVVGDGPDALDAASSATLLLGAAAVRLVVPQHRVAPLVMDGAALLSSARRRALAASLQPHYTAPQPGPLAKALKAPAKRRFWALVSDLVKPAAVLRTNPERGPDLPAASPASATASPPLPTRAAPSGGSSLWRLRRANTLLSPSSTAAAAAPAAAGKPLVLWAPSLRDPRFVPYLDRSLREELMGQLGEGELGLFRGLVHPDVPGLAFIGFQQGASKEVLELQAQWLAAHLAGQLALPSAAAMRADVAAQRAWRSGALAHPLMSAGGSLARRHEQCYVEQLQRDLRGASLAMTSTSPSAVAWATADHRHAGSATASRPPIPRQEVTEPDAVQEGAPGTGRPAGALRMTGKLPSLQLPPPAECGDEAEDGVDFYDEELENTFGVASPPSAILHAAGTGRGGGRRAASTTSGQAPHRCGRHSQPRSSAGCVETGVRSARSAVLGSGGQERSSAASVGGTSAGSSHVLSGCGERTSAGSTASTTTTTSAFFARFSGRVSWFSSIAGGAGAAGSGVGGTGSPLLSPYSVPLSPSGGGKAALSKPPAAAAAAPMSPSMVAPLSLASPTSPTTPLTPGEQQSYDRADSSVRTTLASPAGDGSSWLVKPAARTRRGASAAAAVPAAALVPPAAGARARSAMSSAAVAAAAHAAAARARAVTQQVAAAMNASAAARGRELGVGGAGADGHGDGASAVDGRFSAPTRPARCAPMLEEGQDEDESEPGQTRHTYNGPYHVPAAPSLMLKASSAGERHHAHVQAQAGQLLVQQGAVMMTAMQQQLQQAAMAAAEAAVMPIPAPQPVRLPASTPAGAVVLGNAAHTAVSHPNGGYQHQAADPKSDCAHAGAVAAPTPRAVHLNVVAREERDDAGAALYDTEDAGASASTCAFTSPTAAAACTHSQSPSLVLTYATSTGAPSPRSFRALQRNESNGSIGVPAPIGAAAAAHHGIALAKATGALPVASLTVTTTAAEAGMDGSTISGGGTGAFSSGVLGASARHLVAPMTAALRQEQHQQRLQQQHLQLLLLQQQQQQQHAPPPTPSSGQDTPKVLASDIEGQVSPPSTLSALVQPLSAPPMLLLDQAEEEDGFCHNEPSVHSVITPAASTAAVGSNLQSLAAPYAIGGPVEKPLSAKSARTPKGSSLAQALSACLPFVQLKRPAAPDAEAEDGRARSAISPLQNAAAVVSETGGTGCAALTATCGLTHRLSLGGPQSASTIPAAPTSALVAAEAASGGALASSIAGAATLASRSSTAALVDPPQQRTPVAELVDDAERSARRMSRLMRQRRAVSSTGEDPADAGPDSNGNSGGYGTRARTNTRFSYNGAVPMTGAGTAVYAAAGANLHRGHSSGLWGIVGSRRSSGGGAGAGAACVLVPAAPQSARRTSAGGRSSRASSGAFRVSNGGGSLYVSGAGGGGGIGVGAYYSGAAMADASGMTDGGADLSIWGDGAALDLMTSQIEALRTHLRDPRVVPFPSVGAASPPIASPLLPTPRSSRPSPSPSPRLSLGWPRSPSSAAVPAPGLGAGGHGPGALPASSPSPPAQKRLLHTAQSLPDQRHSQPQLLLLQPHPSLSVASAGKSGTFEPLARPRPPLRSHPGHPERPTADGACLPQPSASVAQVALTQASPHRQVTLPPEALARITAATAAAPAVAADAATPASRSVPTTPQAPAAVPPAPDPQQHLVFKEVVPTEGAAATPGALVALPSIGSRVAPLAAAAAAVAAAAAAASNSGEVSDWTPFSSFRHTAALQLPPLPPPPQQQHPRQLHPQQAELDSTCLATASFIRHADGDEDTALGGAPAAAPCTRSTADGVMASPAGSGTEDNAAFRVVCKGRSVPDLRVLHRLFTIPEHRRNQPTSANTLNESETDTGSGIAAPVTGGGGLNRSFSGVISFTHDFGPSAVSSSTRAHSFGSYLGFAASESQTGFILTPAAACPRSDTAASASNAPARGGSTSVPAAAPGIALGAGNTAFVERANGHDVDLMLRDHVPNHPPASTVTGAGIIASLMSDVARRGSSGNDRGDSSVLPQGSGGNTHATEPQAQRTEPTIAFLPSPKARSPLPRVAAPPPQLVSPVEPTRSTARTTVDAPGSSAVPRTALPPSLTLNIAAAAGRGAGGRPMADERALATRWQPVGFSGVGCSTPPGTSAAASKLLVLPELPAGDGYYSGYPHTVPNTPTTLTPFSTAAGPSSQPSWQLQQHSPPPQQPCQQQAPLPQRTSRTSAVAAALTGLLSTAFSGSFAAGGGASTAATNAITTPRPRLTRQSTGGASMASLSQLEQRPSGIAANAVIGGVSAAGAGGAAAHFSGRIGGGAGGWLDGRTSAPTRGSRKFLLGMLGSASGGAGGGGAGGVGGGLLSAAADAATLPYRKRLSSGLQGSSPPKTLAAALPTSSPPAASQAAALMVSLSGGIGSQRSLAAPQQQQRPTATAMAAAAAAAAAAARTSAPAPTARGRRATVPSAGCAGGRSCLMEFGDDDDDNDDNTQAQDEHEGGEFPESAATAAASASAYDRRRSAPPLLHQGTHQVPFRDHLAAATIQAWRSTQQHSHLMAQPTATSSVFEEEETSWPALSTGGGGVFALSGVSPDSRAHPASLISEAEALVATAALPVLPNDPQPPLSPFQAAAANALLHASTVAVLPAAGAQGLQQSQTQPDARANDGFGFTCHHGQTSAMLPQFSLGDTAETHAGADLLPPPPADLSPPPPPALPLRRATVGGVGASTVYATAGGPNTWSYYSSCGGGHALPTGETGAMGPLAPGPFRSAGSCGGTSAVQTGGSTAGAEEKHGSPAWLVRHASEARQEQIVTQISSWLREALKQKFNAQ
ncbi:hypothetical protein HYH02_001245 [Chlamydomonas schloesseri]|uniref:Uncharacterized protein n=1 Tax=Chlamydomonas schloesseri TaxID=2026947 RepID=A0A835WV47_9CHLO|nr:hypothetical protein HYH02_001245 [Chlamydomonas schloesseri]|eukprot:KAG2454211.1 hypothetical protein HYH02_001245 [Chlamydomonas schloesseri]